MKNNYIYVYEGNRLVRFNKPTQVKFVNDVGVIMGGIAFHDIIICGCCGGYSYIDDIYEYAKRMGFSVDEAIVPLDNWTNVEYVIRGDDNEEE